MNNLEIKFKSNFENELKNLIKKEYNLTDEQTITLSKKIIKDCQNIPKEYEYRSPFALTTPVKDFEVSKKFLEQYNLFKDIDTSLIDFIDKIESIKLVLIDESFGYIQCISNCELYDSQLSILSIFFHNEYIIINQLLSPVSNSGSEINTTDEIAFDEYLMDANKAIKDAFKNIKLYCAYTTCNECIIRKNQFLITPNTICPFALSMLNTDSEEE